MKILALDTSHSACSIALWLDGQLDAVHHVAPMQQAKLVLPLLQDLLAKNALKLSQLDALAFGQGPGSFTGVRIAASVMQGLAYAIGLPLIAISSLAATAQSAYDDHGWQKCLVATDARIHEVYWGVYETNPLGYVELTGIEIVCSPQQIRIPPGSGWYGIGNAWQEYQDALLANCQTPPVAIDPTKMPTASAVARLAERAYAQGLWHRNVADNIPVYLRDNVAIKGK